MRSVEDGTAGGGTPVDSRTSMTCRQKARPTTFRKLQNRIQQLSLIQASHMKL
jgi:hypothetical protein